MIGVALNGRALICEQRRLKLVFESMQFRKSHYFGPVDSSVSIYANNNDPYNMCDICSFLNPVCVLYYCLCVM